MSMRRYKEGANRSQSMLLPPSIEEYVSNENPIRAIEAYVESLNLEELGFQNSSGKLSSGQPAYSPASLLKLYIYGYQNRITSSRRLEKEAHRNLELIWLMEDLKPSYKTIADFRKNNPEALKRVSRDFVLLCKELGLLGADLVAIDGSFFQGNASKKSIVTKTKLEKSLKALDERIEAYYKELQEQDSSDDRDGLKSLILEENLDEKLSELKRKTEELSKKREEKIAQLQKMESENTTQLSSTDVDARRLNKGGGTVAGYNVQHSVDEKNKIIIDHKVTNEGNDNRQLSSMGKRSKTILEVDELEIAADSGYYSTNEIVNCIREDITPFVAIPDKSKAIKDQGRFTREEFKYDKDRDVYYCPAGHMLTPKGNGQIKNGVLRFLYRSNKKRCQSCILKDQCLKKDTNYRNLYRSEHDDIIEEHQKRMLENKDMMKKRASIVEHPFGTIKRRLGNEHFLLRGFKKVSGEMSLIVLSYNLTRAINILGLDSFKEKCQYWVQKHSKAWA